MFLEGAFQLGPDRIHHLAIQESYMGQSLQWADIRQTGGSVSYFLCCRHCGKWTEVQEFASASVSKARVTLPRASGFVSPAQMCPAFFPSEVAGTGARGHFLPERFLQQTQCLLQAASASVLSGTAICPPPKNTRESPLCLMPTFSRRGPLPALIDPSPWMCLRPSTSLLLLCPGHHSSSRGSLQQPPEIAQPGPRLPHL